MRLPPAGHADAGRQQDDRFRVNQPEVTPQADGEAVVDDRSGLGE